LPQLSEALRADQARRWRSGRRLPAEACLEAFPQLAGSAEDALGLTNTLRGWPWPLRLLLHAGWLVSAGLARAMGIMARGVPG
jgi:hypothetical protein